MPKFRWLKTRWKNFIIIQQKKDYVSLLWFDDVDQVVSKRSAICDLTPLFEIERSFICMKVQHSCYLTHNITDIAVILSQLQPQNMKFMNEMFQHLLA